MILRLSPSSGVPVYLQIIEQVKHAIATGGVNAGEQLPSVRQMAEDLLINPNTVARAYRELEQEGIIELKHGAGAFISESIAPPSKSIHKAQAVVKSAIEQLASFNLAEEEIRRLIENELAWRKINKPSRKKYA
jgi:GntR family transcriptional regulator